MSELLTRKRTLIWRLFQMLIREPIPEPTLTAEEAWRQGLKAGYNRGLLDGVGIGMEVLKVEDPEVV